MTLDKKHKLLIIINLLLIIVIGIISIHYKIPQKVITKIGLAITTKANYDPNDNYKYQVRRSLFEIYPDCQYDYVFLGDSITYGVEWNELLLQKVANRGIGSDTTFGFIERLSEIINLKPKKVFIMGGINDIGKGYNPNEIFENMVLICGKLLENEIEPVIQSTLFISKRKSNYIERNRQVNELNNLLKNYCMNNGINYIDINAELSTNEFLIEDYTYDGVHLLGKGYEIWKRLLIPYL